MLERQEFEPIGSSKTIKVNVRVIAATNRDLSAMMREGKFRSDLFYRLNVVPVTLPALRERADDIPLLTMFFLEKSSRKLGRQIRQVAEETILRLCEYAWPGNIRELQNVIERAVVLASGSVLSVDESALPGTAPRPFALPPEAPISAPSIPTSPPQANTDNASLEGVERQHILSVLEKVNWRIEGMGGAAKVLHLEPSTLRSRMKRLGITRQGR